MSTYKELFRIQGQYCFDSCPLIVEAGTLLKNETNGRILVQLKLCNISNRLINSCKVEVVAYEPNGDEVEKVLHQYLDVNIGKGIPFGAKEPIYLNNQSSRSYDVIVTEIVFADGEVLKTDFTSGHLIDNQEQVSDYISDRELQQQYIREVGEGALYIPRIIHGLYQCTCGQLNQSFDEKCCVCGREFDMARKALDIDYLKNSNDKRKEYEVRKREEELERQENERRIKEEEQKRKEEAEGKLREGRARRKKRITSVILVVLGIVVAFMLIFIFVLPGVFVKSGNYLAAVKIYQKTERIGKAHNVQIMYIKSLVETEEYKTAIEYAINNGVLDEEGITELKRVELLKSGEYDYLYDVEVGDTVLFGECVLDGHRESLEWSVVDRKHNSLLLLAKRRVFSITYKYTNLLGHTELMDEINNQCLEKMFSEQEKMLIKNTEIKTLVHSSKKIEENDTAESLTNTEKVFLLSVEEVNQYYPNVQELWENGVIEGQSVLTMRDIYAPGNITTRLLYFITSEGHTKVDITKKGFSVEPAIWIDISDEPDID